MRHVKFLTLAGLFVIVSAGAAQADDYRDVVRSSDGQIVHDEAFGTCVRTKWITDKDACANCPVAEEHTIIAREDRTVYFAFNEAVLTEESMERLDSLAERINAASDIEGVRVVGFADRIGTASYNEKLSKKRAQTVRDYLVTRGIANASVTKTRWVGKSESNTPCPKGDDRTQLIECLQPDRKVEVEIVYRRETMVTPAPAPARHHHHPKQQ